MTVGTDAVLPDETAEHDVRLVVAAPDTLGAFNRAGVLAPADVHTAATLCRLAGDERGDVLLATALAARAPRVGHVCIQLGHIARSATADVADPAAAGELAWPDPAAWRAALVDSPLVNDGGTPESDGREVDAARPLVLAGERLYLDRLWRDERRVADALALRAGASADRETTAEPEVLTATLGRLFPEAVAPDRQRLAAAVAATRRLTVVAGGPGTGKTTTVARMLALFDVLADARGTPAPRVGLAAPTGKAADRLTAALRAAAGQVPADTAVRDRLASAAASTIHRLLGPRPDTRTRFRHHAGAPLPHDVVVVDEASMIGLSLMARLLEAVRPDARLVLVGDPHQLSSVEAGAVLGDVVGPVLAGMAISAPARERLAAVAPDDLAGVADAAAPGITDGIVLLDRVHRFRTDSDIARLAAAVQRGDADAAATILAEAAPAADVWADDPVTAGAGLRWLEPADLAGVRREVVAHARTVHAAAVDGDAAGALDALGRLRVLCAHRRGPRGVRAWVERIEGWLAAEVAGFAGHERWYLGRPVLVTANDHRLGLFNGDVGVVVAGVETPAVAFDRGEGRPPRLIAPSRLEAVETVHAMTIHKSQGSQFDRVVVVLPDADSPLANRELLYTAVTRARHGVTVVGDEASLRAAATHRIQRASGLQDALWGDLADPRDAGPG